MSELPLFFRLDRDCFIYLLSDFLAIEDVGRLDTAFTMKKKVSTIFTLFIRNAVKKMSMCWCEC